MTSPKSEAPHFLNMRTMNEMPTWKRWLWRIIGTKRVGTDDDWTVTAYTFRNITLIWSLESKGS